MIKRSIITLVLTAGLSLLATAKEDEDVEEKASLETIPAAAAKTLKEHAGGAKITNVSKERDKGRPAFEATFTKNGRVHDVTVDEAGKLIADEEVVPVSEAPEAVRAAIEKEHPGGKVDKFEKITEEGKVGYEALISGKDKREEIKFDDKGTVVEREDKTKKREKKTDEDDEGEDEDDEKEDKE